MFAIRDLLDKAGVLQLLDRSPAAVPLGIAWRAARDPRSIRHEIELHNDIRALGRRYPFLRTGPASGEGRPLLVVSLTDWPSQVKVEAILAKALQLRGFTPWVLTQSHCWHARRYFRRFGISNFISLDRLGSPDEDRALGEEGAAIAARIRTFTDAMQLTYRGVFVGRHVLSNVCRMLQEGTPDVGDPRVRRMLERLIPDALRTVARAERLRQELNPGMTMFQERGYSPYGEVYDVFLNAGVTTIQWQGAHINEALTLRRCTAAARHDHPFSLADETWENVTRREWTADLDAELTQEFEGRYREGAWFNRQRLQDGKQIKEADAIRAQLGLDPAKKTAVIFSHLLWDATFFYGDDIFDNYEEWLVESVKAACRNPRVNWVVKLHPANAWKADRAAGATEFAEEVVLRRRIGPLPDHVVLLRPETDINTYSFFSIMDYCLTVRGTIGMEAPCFGIPVLTAGTGRYSGRGFTCDSTSREQFLERLASIERIPRLTTNEMQLARRHAYTLFRLRPLPFSSFRMIYPESRPTGRPLEYDVEICLGSLDEFKQAADLEAFTDWAIDSDHLDFLYTAARPRASHERSEDP